MEIDTSTDFGKVAVARLTDDLICWLTTVSPNGTPQPIPVWYFWENGTVLVYSQPSAPKIRYIAAHPQVSVNLNSETLGGGIVTLLGEAHIDEDAPAAHEHAAFVTKYAAQIARRGYTPETFARKYSVAVRITPSKLRGH